MRDWQYDASGKANGRRTCHPELSPQNHYMAPASPYMAENGPGFAKHTYVSMEVVGRKF